MRAGKCRHYRGTVERRCAAGIVLKTLAGGGTQGWGTRLPCGYWPGEPVGGERATCASFSPVTAAEEEADRAAVKIMLAHVLAAKKLVPRQPGKYLVVCPACGGHLHTERHGNGHVWARCDSKDCLSWLE
jgi:hypothetical protein